MMEESAKNGEQLLWAYELRLQNVHLHQRLKALEDKLSKQQDRAADSERESHSARNARLDELTKQVATLQEREASERIAGFTVELREMRQHLEQLRDEMKHSEKAKKDAESKVKKREADVDGRLARLESVVAKTHKAQQSFEARSHEATERAAQLTVTRLEALSDRHYRHIDPLSEQLQRVEQAQIDLRALFGSGHHETPVTSANVGPSDSERPSKKGSKPTTVPVESPAAELEQKKPPTRKGRGKAFEKEIAQLIHGDGSLTNAPAILESQQLLAPTTRGQKKRAPEPDEEPSARSAFRQRETRSQVKKIEEELGASKPKAAEKPTKVAKATNARRAPKSTIKATQPSKQPAKANKAPARKRPPPLPTSDEIEVGRSREPSVARQSYEIGKDAIASADQQGQPPQGIRRRIQQDDTEEEFFAKALAIKGEA